jgi:hypothetical protein
MNDEVDYVDRQQIAAKGRAPALGMIHDSVRDGRARLPIRLQAEAEAMLSTMSDRAARSRVDDGPWMPPKLLGPPPRAKKSRGFAWRFWGIDWGTPAAGEHQITSRAFDADGNMQPAPHDPFLASRRTFWESNGHITRRVLIP